MFAGYFPKNPTICTMNVNPGTAINPKKNDSWSVHMQRTCATEKVSQRENVNNLEAQMVTPQWKKMNFGNHRSRSQTNSVERITFNYQ